MDKILSISRRSNISVIEDSAQAILSYYKNKPVGIMGYLSALSFHETKQRPYTIMRKIYSNKN
jgi:dTDP-4-amino-4,6-dideoxygalactose transaminase